MTTMLPPVYGAAFEFDVVLFAQSDNQIKTTPTIASGDFVISKANGATANLTTTPSESPASSGIVRVQLSATEMEADKLTVKWHDASGAEWHDGAVCIHTSGQTFNAMDSILDDILTDTGTTLDTLIKDIPTVAEFEARTIAAADYATATALATVDGIVDDILADTGTDGVVVNPRTVEGAIDEIEALRLLLAGMVGKASGGGTATVTFRDTGDTKDRIVLTVDSSGNRSAVTLDAS